MTFEIWLSIAAIAIALASIAATLWFASKRSEHAAISTHRRHLDDRYTGLERELGSLRDRSKLLSERVDRHERIYQEIREEYLGLREQTETRLTRSQAHDQALKELQEQLNEMRQETRVLMDRDERHDRRVTELQEQLNDFREDLSRIPGDGAAVAHGRKG